MFARSVPREGYNRNRRASKVLSPEKEVDNERQHDTEQKARYDGDVKAPPLAVNVDVSRQPSDQGNLVDVNGRKARNDEHDPHENEQAPGSQTGVHRIPLFM